MEKSGVVRIEYKESKMVEGQAKNMGFKRPICPMNSQTIAIIIADRVKSNIF